ncbi:FAD-dependent monooxygenase [Siccirubricoccus sp. KC 17139]|uniref:FAD-dependent monooxygenase n=1 Tax=Siccirubricoccus soli TaxID=2899147 RepID=A0ABT1D8V6_9PROT|nr:FAD-dependent monooxygenase [Siccirubricoccus soli]MCO6417614.1 FAD-dependent monooxygenase [Siccirubricoccus soli]MCP2683749.1 FAD-dependent monooxygenase [Siccirubricoccus soli]
MPETQVLIVGAGPTGLVLAIQLARHGIACRIIDRAAGPGEASRAMAVHARTLEFYRQFGFADQVAAAGIPMATLHLRQAGREVARLELGALGAGESRYPFILSLPQDEHERLLGAQLSALGLRVEWGVELRALAEIPGGLRATLAGPAGEESCEAAWLCGCDGAHSRVRQAIGLGFPGGTYAQRFYVADVAIAGPARPDIEANIAAQGLALLFPVRRAGMQRVIGILPPELGDRDDVTFDAVRPVAEAMLGISVERANWFSTYHVHHRVAAGFRRGRAFLAGDAGHIHSPAGGQGMNTGIGDAVNLGWKLAEVLQGQAAESLLESYEQERIGFARTLVATTDRAFTALVGTGPGSRLLRQVVLPRLAPLLLGIGPVRRRLFRTASQIRIAYPDSPLSEGRAGALAAGARLPFLEVPGGDSHAPLDGLGWRLQLHGEAAPPLRAAAAELGLPLDTFPWSAAAGRAGLARDAAYLLRPDGHIGLAWEGQDPARLRAYAAKHGLRFGQGGSP